MGVRCPTSTITRAPYRRVPLHSLARRGLGAPLLGTRPRYRRSTCPEEESNLHAPKGRRV
jgi:hypothetical protein